MNLDAKVNALIAAADKPAAESPGEPATPSSEGAEPSAGVAPAATMSDVFAEKLAKVREARKASTVLRDAKARASEAAREAAQAKADREAAATERQRWEGLKNGSFLDGIKAMGKDPAVAFAEMQREAIEAGTPEAQMRRMREEFEKQLGEQVAPLQKTIEELRKERDAERTHSNEAAFHSDFSRAVANKDYQELRIEYPDDRLFAYAKNFRDNPDFFYSVAEQHKVNLTSPERGFTMTDILNVLQSVQDAHRKGTESRRAAIAPPPIVAEESPAPRPTVNGTAERRKAGQTIGNDMATARAADGKFVPQGSTAAQRVRERARRLGGG